MIPQLRGLIETRQRRGLQGFVAREAWIMESLELLLRAELAQLEKEKQNEARGE